MRLSPTGAALLFAFVGASALALSPLIAPDTAPQSAMVTGFALEFFLGMLAISFASLAGSGVRERLGLGRSRIPWGTCLVLVLGTLLLSFALNVTYELTGSADDGALHQFESDLSGIGGWTIALAISSFALAPAIGEEMLCRGLIQRGLHERFGPAVSVGLAALLFGALHVEPIYALLATILGAYLGVIALLGCSIRPSILCHGANNLIAVLTAAWGHEIDIGESFVAIWLLVAFVLAAAALGWAWHSLGGLPSADAEPENSAVGLQPGFGSDDS